MAQTRTRTTRIGQAVADAQRLANADGRPYVVARGARRDGPLVEPVAGLEILGSFLAQLVDAGRVLLVTPQGMFPGMTAAEILGVDR